ESRRSEVETLPVQNGGSPVDDKEFGHPQQKERSSDERRARGEAALKRRQWTRTHRCERRRQSLRRRDLQVRGDYPCTLQCAPRLDFQQELQRLRKQREHCKRKDE